MSALPTNIFNNLNTKLLTEITNKRLSSADNIINLGKNTYSILEDVENFTRTMQSLLKVLEFGYNSKKKDLENRIQQVQEYTRNRNIPDLNYNMEVDTVEYYDEKNDYKIDSVYQQKLESTSDYCYNLSNQIPFVLRNISGNVSNVLFFSMDNLDPKLKNVKFKMDLFSKTLYKFILQYEIKNNNPVNYNMIYSIVLRTYYTNQNVKDYNHMNLLIVLKRDNMYHFIRYDPWGMESHDTNNLTANSFNTMFNDMLRYTVDIISRTKNRMQSYTYSKPQLFGDNIQTVIERQNLTSWEGLCVFICIFIAYLLYFDGFGDNSKSNYNPSMFENDLKSLTKKENFSENFFPEVARNFSILMSNVLLPDINNFIRRPIVNYHPDYDKFITEIANMLKDSNQINGLNPQQAYNQIQHNINYVNKYKYVLDLGDQKINGAEYVILLCNISRFDMVYILLRQNNASESIKMFFNKKYKQKYEYCDEKNLCEQKLLCRPNNQIPGNILLDLNEKIYSLFTNTTRYCDSNIERKSLTDEEKLQIHYLKSVESEYLKVKTSTTDFRQLINILKNNICNLHYYDRRFGETCSEINKILLGQKQIPDIVTSCKQLFKFIFLDNILVVNSIIDRSIVEMRDNYTRQTFLTIGGVIFTIIDSTTALLTNSIVNKYFTDLRRNDCYNNPQNY